MLRTSDIAARPDLQLGDLLVSPSRRRIEGPAGAVQVEPRTMQVFLLLLDAAGKVVTRNQLFDECWGGAMVGDDSLNRAIGKVRKIAAETAPGFFEVETIPRTGYRLVGEINQAVAAVGQPAQTSQIPRRALIVVGLASAVAGGLGLWRADVQKDREFTELMRRGEQTLEQGDPAADPAEFFRRAAAIRPDDARARGLLAYSRAMWAAYEPASGSALQEADSAARTALDLDSNEPNALLAQTLLRRSSLDFAATEDRLRAILHSAPQNTSAMRQLWNMLQCVGRSRDALNLVERALAVQPLGAANHFPRAQLLWILGRNAEADRVIDRAMQYWPTHRNVRYARFIIFAFTGRPRAALAMLEGKGTAPQTFSSDMISLWRMSLSALEEPSPSAVAAARTAYLKATKKDFSLAYQAVMTLSALGEVDAAFELVNALFVVPPSSSPKSNGSDVPATSTAWRFAPWLFTPPTASLRADPRFKLLCEAAGLSEYWEKRGTKPDYQLGLS